MYKKKLPDEPLEILTYLNLAEKRNQKRSEKSVINSEMSNRQHLKKQNIRFNPVSKEYLALFKEFKESLNHIRKINNELIIAKDKAEESDKLKSSFLANILHEIHTPMNAIIGFSDLVMKTNFSKVKTEEFVKIINASCRQLLTILNDIIEISKIEADQISINKELVNINFLLQNLYTTYWKQANNKKVSLIYNSKPELLLLETETDLNKVKQIVSNLLNNAIKFTKQGRIEFGFDLKKDFIEFFVKDSGIGISLKNQSIIFDRFRQVDNSYARTYEGIGLGLGIAKALVEKLGGHITVSSKLHKGSTFTFTIPYVHPKYIAEDTKTSTEVNPSVNWEGKSILVAEDEILNHTYIEKILSSTNVKIFHAWNGENAIEMVKNYSAISLVLMDIKMPVLNGYEATRRIKDANPELPVIAITAYALSYNKVQALQAGFDNYISKPIPKENLIKIMAGYLN